MLPKKKKEKYSTKQQAKRICNPRMLSKLTKDRVEKKKEIKKIDRPFQKGKKKKRKKIHFILKRRQHRRGEHGVNGRAKINRQKASAVSGRRVI